MRRAAVGSQLGNHCLQINRSIPNRLGALLVARDVLLFPAIHLHASVDEILVLPDACKNLHGRRRGRHARAMESRIDIDHDVQRAGHRGGQRSDVGNVIDHYREIAHAFVQRPEPLQRRLRDDGGSNQEGIDAALRERLRLSQLRAAQANCTGGDLAFRDVDALVRLGMRSQRYSARLGERRHLANVSIQGIPVDDQDRRIEVGARPGPADE